VPHGKHFDGGGLYLHVKPNGARYWRLKYRHGGKEKLLALGVFPEVTLAEARRRRDEARAQMRDDKDPASERRLRRQAAAPSLGNTFEVIAREWMKRQSVADVTRYKNTWLFESFLFPAIGARPIHDIKPRELLAVLRDIEGTGKHETAIRAKNKAGQVFRFAILEGKTNEDPTASLRGALKAPAVKHHAAVTDPAKVGELLRAIDGFSGQLVTALALRFAPLVFVRPGELRRAEWEEIDFDGAMWRIPASRMKMKAPHLVPLSAQARSVLGDLKDLTGAGRYIFPSIRSLQRPMSENTINAALRRLGYSNGEMTGHGFRSMAATRLNEMGWRADAIERQLAHAESNKVRDAYTSAAQYLNERKQMMQAWGDYLDGLKAGKSNVILMRDHLTAVPGRL
jgi:integrase